MFLNILRISASNVVLKMFLNILIVSNNITFDCT